MEEEPKDVMVLSAISEGKDEGEEDCEINSLDSV